MQAKVVGHFTDARDVASLALALAAYNPLLLAGRGRGAPGLAARGPGDFQSKFQEQGCLLAELHSTMRIGLDRDREQLPDGTARSGARQALRIYFSKSDFGLPLSESVQRVCGNPVTLLSHQSKVLLDLRTKESNLRTQVFNFLRMGFGGVTAQAC